MTYLQWFYLVLYISIFSAGATYIYSIFAKPRRELKLIQILLLLSFLFDLSTEITKHFLELRLPPVGASYRVVELSILFAFYRRIFPSKINAYFSWVVQIVVFTFFLLNFSSLHNNATVLRIINCILFTIYSLCYYQKVLHRLNISDPTKDPLFWANSSILIYFLSIVLIMLFFKPLAKIDEASAVILYIFHNVFVIARNAMFGVAFWVWWRSKKQVNLN